jgi:putative FmdB family regulatory protein
VLGNRRRLHYNPERPRKKEGAMPTYDYLCTKCQKEFTVTMTVRERESTTPACPGCGSKELEPVMGSFFSKTSRKS